VAKETQEGVDQKAAELVEGGIKMKTPPPEELDDVCMLVIPINLKYSKRKQKKK
jgi:hypothetical protein